MDETKRNEKTYLLKEEMMLAETLVFLPGVLSDHRVWSYQISHLSELVTCRVIPLVTSNNTSDLLQTVLSQVEGNFFLAGHSMGGWLALELARKVPERVLKLCLLNTSAQPDSVAKQQSRMEMIQAVEQGAFQTVAAALAERYVYSKKVKKDVLSMFLSVGEQAFVNQQKALLTRQECSSFLHQLPMPTLVIHAQQDKNFSLAVHQELVAKIPQAKLAIIEDSGHMCPMESPQAVTALLRFWLNYF
ncbi:alpha/beta fold hydrolase [Legionella maioricensis]|uniref:Alpha/beta hydrolase n=1 Tax=Legionella maioricensis TaxID=2896528 RepID=A0A9X2IDA2_9GAMM|nr:alpha/beta hydrolase [Legionella maioricensis]MCL9684548.1 alpha/beta hydrolase [Legionella maioricensis]MCL9687858.1 alpha/beta hydrolase [Legionella maioricensis]